MTADVYTRVLAQWVAWSGGTDKSPIGIGGSVLHSVLNDRARELVGDAAFTEDDEGEVNFTSDWRGAYEALMGAAVAYGAPELGSQSDREVLASAWRARFGGMNERSGG